MSPDEELAALKALVRDYCAAERRAEDARAGLMKLGKKRNPAPAQTERKLRAASLAADEARELFKRMREVVK